MRTQTTNHNLLNGSILAAVALAPALTVGAAQMAGVGSAYGGSLAAILTIVWGLSLAAMGVEALSSRGADEALIGHSEPVGESAADAVHDEAEVSAL